ncbi:MAG: hypothetical protein CMA86_05525 [Euryarchaeota archaeon]|nr:hypothetical protein [Euryarchaeota archaeon]
MPVTLSESWCSFTAFTSVGAAFPFLPLLVHGDATATAGAQPTHAIPSFATFSAGVEAFHLATAGALLSDDSGHDCANYVVNINAPF